MNSEKLTVKKWWIFGADFFTVWCRFFTVYADFSRFVRDINGEKKHLVIDELFHGFFSALAARVLMPLPMQTLSSQSDARTIAFFAMM